MSVYRAPPMMPRPMPASLPPADAPAPPCPMCGRDAATVARWGHLQTTAHAAERARKSNELEAELARGVRRGRGW